MLRATIAINRREIGKLEIVRVKGQEGGPCTYRCRLGSGATWAVDHHYDDGAWRLVQKAIEQMPKLIAMPNMEVRDAE